MKNKNFISGLIFSFLLVLTSTLNLFAQQQRYQGEIMVTVCGMTGQDTKWTVTATALSSIRWHILNDQCYITTSYSSASVSGEGNDAMPSGFRCPCQHDDDDRDLAFSEYRFSWDLPAPHSDPDPITLDLRDADWACNYNESDITIRYSITNSKYEVRIGGQGNPFNELTDDTIWDILDEAPPNQDAFQPIPPQNFHCTNPTAYGQHPQFEWETPEEPDGVTFYYNIYRDLGAGYRKITANPLTATEYTDTGIEIIKFGSNTAHYYVTAKGSGSPESDASNIVDIKTNTAEKILPEQETYDNKEANYVEPSQIRLLNNYPNPFNTTTVIKFEIPTKMPVKAAVYNLLGEEIRILFDGDKPAGRYDITWDGKNEDGLIMPSGIYLGILTTANQQEVKKLILVK